MSETDVHKSNGRPFPPYVSQDVFMRATARMLHPLLSMAFSQWREHVCASRARRQLMGQLACTRRWTSLAFTFSLWRRQTQTWQQAERHREAVLLTSCLSQWKGVPVGQRAEAQMQRRAEQFHSAAVLRHCFSAWHGRLRRVCVGPGMKAGAQLASRTAWLQRRDERRRTHSAFTLWRARFKQFQAVTAFYTSATLTRVFVAWRGHGQHHRSMMALARAQPRQTLLGSALARWRGWTSRLQEARRRGKERLALQARESLQRWREHTRRRCVLRLLLCQYVEGNRRRVVEEALLIWVQEAHKVKRAQDLHQHNLTRRVIQRWNTYSQHRIKEQNSILTMEVQRQQRAMQWAFTSWRGRVLHKQGVARTVAHHWRFRAQESRAASHYLVRLELRFFCMWRLALLWRRERRQRARELGRKWALLARQRAARQERALVFREDRERGELAQRFWYWVALHRSWKRSLDFHQQMLCRRAILSWHAHAGPAIARKHCGANLQQSRDQRLVLQCLTHWRSELGQAQHRQEVLGERLSQRNRRLTENTMNYWRTATRGSTALRQLNNGRLQQCIDHWRTRTHISRAARIMCVQRARRDTQQVLLAWRQWARVSTGQRQMGEAVGLWVEGHRVSRAFQLWVRVHQSHKDASRLSSAHLVRRFFQGWREVVKESMFTWRSTENKVCTALIRSAFSLWRRRAASHKASQDLAQRVTARRRRTLLRSSLHTWHQEVQSRRRRSLLLSEKYYACWVERATATRNKRRSLLEWRLREYIRRWRLEAVLRRVQRRHTQDLWDNWRDQTAATLLLRALASTYTTHTHTHTCFVFC
ncbi:protein SFI1 homolog [Osmerus eperlanus]|uniref:protein SFI1 homolog n=1 Tax=Osmerus eperlanus TaxID=29151 RepID=UPI002E144AEB